jgi:uncharacterized protein Veg
MIVASASAATAAPGEQVLHGTIEQVDGPRIVLRADDGQRYTIDTTGVPGFTLTGSTGREVTVTARAGQQPGQLDAVAIEAGRAGGWQRIHGTIQNVEGANVTLRGDDGRLYTIDTTAVPGFTLTGSTGREVTVTARAGQQPGQLEAVAIEPGSGTASPGDGWQRIHGRVQSVQGTNVTLRADDGRLLTLDASKVSPAIRQALTPNEGVTVVGHQWLGPNRLQAEYIQQDASDPSRGGTVVGQTPGQPVDESAWQRIHGVVQKVEGSRLTLKADDGRIIDVDAAQVNPAVRQALTPGEGVTVTGFYRNNRNQVAARYIQQDRSAPAASPR